MPETHLTDTRFNALKMAPELLRGVQAADFTHCTPIQRLSLPHALQGRDVAGQAQTGTGKTAAFLLATMQRLLTRPPRPWRRQNQPRGVVLAPTRELAIQIEKDARALGRYSGLQSGVVYGGAGYNSQREMLERGVDILIGTPGRMIDYFKQKVFDFKALEVMVLDEADRMFDLGFIDDIRYLLRRMPEPRQRLNMLFSATLSYRVTELAYEHMNNPVEVEIEPDRKTVDTVRQVVYYTAMSEKVPLLLGLLTRQNFKRAILFVNTKRTGEKVAAYLRGNAVGAAIISGDVPQNKRIRLLEDFSNGDLALLVATDVAARGLHIPDVSHVINYDLPTDPEDYIHRIGRTARAGAEGDAISFACEQYSYSLPDIEDYVGHKIPNQPVAPELLVQPRPPVRDPQQRYARPPRGKGKPAAAGKSGGKGKAAHSDKRQAAGKGGGKGKAAHSGKRQAAGKGGRPVTGAPKAATSGRPRTDRPRDERAKPRRRGQRGGRRG